VDITGSGASLSYAYSLTQGALHFGGGNSIDTLLQNVSGTVSTATASGGSFTYAHDASPNGDGLGSFNQGFTCTNAGSGGQCGTSATASFTGSGLGADFITTGGFQIFAGADITCVATGVTCSNNPAGLLTGAVGATLAPVPGPIVGAGLPGLI